MFTFFHLPANYRKLYTTLSKDKVDAILKLAPAGAKAESFGFRAADGMYAIMADFTEVEGPATKGGNSELESIQDITRLVQYLER